MGNLCVKCGFKDLSIIGFFVLYVEFVIIFWEMKYIYFK